MSRVYVGLPSWMVLPDSSLYIRPLRLTKPHIELHAIEGVQGCCCACMKLMTPNQPLQFCRKARSDSRPGYLICPACVNPLLYATDSSILIANLSFPRAVSTLVHGRPTVCCTAIPASSHQPDETSVDRGGWRDTLRSSLH